MRSRAHLKTHPLHPILVAFPIAFFIGAFLFDVLALLNGRAALGQTAYYLNMAGIAGALLAAVPGIIDFVSVVPPQSSAKDRAAKHGIINVVNVLLFGFVLYYRQREDAGASIVVGLEAVGVVLLCIAGWMGGTLVHRNQIGVDHRYAHAGKWKEAYFTQSSGRIAVAATGELQVNALKLLHVAGRRIALGRTENGYVAFDDRCTHKGGPLSDGALICGTVQCPWHGSHFDVHNGSVKAGPAKERIKTYPIEEQDGTVYLLL